jgi:hypothetical protein
MSAKFQYGKTRPQSISVSVTTTLPPAADGGPSPSPMPWRPTFGARISETDAAAARPVDCGSTNEDLYDGINESGGAGKSIVCVDSPTPDATRGYVTAPIVDFGITGPTIQVPPGGTTSGTFLAKRSGAADPGTTYSLAASGGVPGGSVMIDRSTAPLGGDSTIPVTATVMVPPGAAPGTYPVTLTGTAPGKPDRTATGNVVVTPIVPPAGGGTGGGGTGGGGGGVDMTPDTRPPTLRSAKLARAKFRVGSKATPLNVAAKRGRTPAGSEIRLDSDEMGRLDVVVERLDAGRRSGSKCSTKAKKGKRCTLVVKAGTLVRKAPAGASAYAFSGRLGSKKLKVGSYRMRLRVTDAFGNASAERTLKFKIVAR